MSLSGAYAKIGALQMEITKFQHRLEDQENRLARLAKKELVSFVGEENQETQKPQEDEEWKRMVISNIEDQARMLTRMRAALEMHSVSLKAEGVFVLLFATWVYMFFSSWVSA